MKAHGASTDQAREVPFVSRGEKLHRSLAAFGALALAPLHRCPPLKMAQAAIFFEPFQTEVTTRNLDDDLR